MTRKEPINKKRERLELLEEQLNFKKHLPHLYGYKMYPWMRAYFESRNKVCLVCSANQIGKSSIQIRKCIHWATSEQLRKELWPHLEPRQFWYLYPSSYVATIEFEKKWMPEFLPRQELQNHPVYGWKADYRARYIQALHFNTGISVYFKTYSQDPQDLQAGPCAALFCDEELPEELYPELQMRLAATDGYFSSVFTPTLGQEFWRLAVESRGYNEKFPDATKIQVSMYDCLNYEDGTPSFWTKERIEKIKAGCKSDAEIQRRIYGKFILDSGLRYQSFNPALNVIKPVDIPNDWPVFIGVDSGSGGAHNHPAAITFVAMRPDYQLGYVFKGRRFDGITTTASDLVEYVRTMRQETKNPIYGVFYDWASPDLKEISSRMGEGWLPAEKSHLIGEQILNVAFKNEMLQIFDIEELQTLIIELKTNRLNQAKTLAHDDHIDATRYAVTKIPWDWSKIGEKPQGPAPKELTEQEQRKKFFFEEMKLDESVEGEIEMWNELMEI